MGILVGRGHPLGGRLHHHSKRIPEAALPQLGMVLNENHYRSFHQMYQKILFAVSFFCNIWKFMFITSGVIKHGKLENVLFLWSL